MLDNKEIFKPLLNRIKRIIDHDSFYYASISTSISLLNKYNRLVKMICRHIANINYDFGAFDANLIISDRTVEEDAVTDWARIDMDDYVPAPLIVDGDKYYEETTELRFVSKPGKFEWTIGYYNNKYEELPT